MRNRNAIREVFGAAVAISVLSWMAPLQAQSNEVTKVAAQVAVEIKRQYSTSEQLDAAITQTYGVKLSADKAEVARRTLRALIFNEAVPEYFAQLFVPLYRQGVTPKELTAAAVEGIAQLQVKGLARLPPERQAAFVSHVINAARSMPATSCKTMFIGQMSTAESALLERKYMAALPLGKFEAISNLYREAAEAELAGYPDARTINAQQAKLAEKVYESASVRRIRAQVPQAIAQRVDQDASSAAPSEVCAVMTTRAEGMLDMPEPYRAWQLTRFAQSMQ